MAAVIVAVGGGGDAITSAVLTRVLKLADDPAIMTFSWDRLLIDPLPGPRRAGDFSGLHRLAPDVLQVTSTTTPIPPAGSSLPRLASELPNRLILLDPTDGAVGLARQIRAAAAYFNADRLFALDVGGDSLTDGHDPELRSPLADQLALAACLASELPTTLLVVGAGIDGELRPDTLASRLTRYQAQHLADLAPNDLAPIQSVLRWHPSEASGLLAAAALGLRGTVEVRDAGDQVRLTDSTPTIYGLDLQAIAADIPAAELIETDSLAAAERRIQSATGVSELRYETDKAARRISQNTWNPTDQDLPRIDAYGFEAASRGADYISLRRLAELVGANTLDAYAALTRLLQSDRPDHYTPGVYRVRAGHLVA